MVSSLFRDVTLYDTPGDPHWGQEATFGGHPRGHHGRYPQTTREDALKDTLYVHWINWINKKWSLAKYIHAREPTSQTHRNQTISRKGANIISRRPSHGQFKRRCCPQAFLWIFSEVTYIRTVGNSTYLKIYTLPNHTISIGVCILETQLLGFLWRWR
jgi:hypothetical protein